jgi:hypothetical protein
MREQSDGQDQKWQRQEVEGAYCVYGLRAVDTLLRQHRSQESDDHSPPVSHNGYTSPLPLSLCEL